MKLIKQRDLIRTTAQRYEEQLFHTFGRYPARIEVLAKLRKLDAEAATASEIDEIIGVKNWCNSFCDECNENVSDVVQIGDEPDYESHTAWICKKCAPKLIALLQQL